MGVCYFYEIFNNISHEILAKQTKPQNFSNENFSTFLSISCEWDVNRIIAYKIYNISIILHTRIGLSLVNVLSENFFFIYIHKK